MQIDNDIYKEIRPYNDDEVSGAIQRLIDDKDFINAILKYRFPHASGMFGWLLIPLIKRFFLSRNGLVSKRLKTYKTKLLST